MTKLPPEWEDFPGPSDYKPLYPWREAATFGLFVIAIAAGFYWILHSLWGSFLAAN
jgi:hypothetical protein